MCWFMQLISYDFIIQYCWDTLNSVNKSSWRLNYMMMKQSKKCHESIEKFYELSFKQFWLIFTQNNNSNLISVENKLILWQIDDLILILVNKLVIAAFRTDKQYSYYIKETNSETEYLIWVLSLQVIIWSKIRLTVNNFVSYRKTLNNFN